MQENIKKCILLSGGTGSRLYPVTQYLNKHLLPMSSLPIIFYPISFLISIGIRELIIIVNPQDLDLFKKLLGNGEKYGIKIEYIIQHGANGLAEPLILSEKLINKDEKFLMMLGDNFFHIPNKSELVKTFNNNDHSTLVLTSVENPKAFGVVESEASGNILSIEEKPENPKSNLIATGLYCYDHLAIEFAKKSEKSDRGELEITDINNKYLEANKLRSFTLNQHSVWFDCGTPESIKKCSDFIESVKQVDNFELIGIPEKVSLDAGLISKKDIENSIKNIKLCDYKNILLDLIK